MLSGRRRPLRLAWAAGVLLGAFSAATGQQSAPQQPVVNAHDRTGEAGRGGDIQPLRHLTPGTPRSESDRAIRRTSRGDPVQPSQFAERPHDPRIASMPSATEELQVIQNRSQLINTRQPVWRVAVTDPAIVEVVQYGPNELAVIGVGLGRTDLWLWFEGSEQPLMYVVTSIRDPEYDQQRQVDYGKLERKLQVLYPNSKVYLIPLSRKIIVRGQARDAEEAARIMQIVRDEIITQEGSVYLAGSGFTAADYGTDAYNNYLSSLIVNELQVPGEFQVMMHVRIAELNRSQLRELGVDWSVLFNDARHQITQAFAAANPVLTGIFEVGEITVAIDALASHGYAKVISDATLVTLSGEPASFLAGGEFAVPSTVALNGVGVGTTTFRGFGSSIIATPTVVDHDLIRLEIIPELSEISGGNAVQGIPGVNVRRVQTRVELREGQTIVLGGLFSRRQESEVTRIPWLGELPLIGNWIFNRKQATEDETELLILVTPEIVRPMDAEEVPPMPGWYVTHPDDFDLYKYSRTEGNPDLGHYQLLPYGNGQGYAHDSGFNIYNPPPVDGRYAPAPASPYVPRQPYAGPADEQPAPAPPSHGASPGVPAARPQAPPPQQIPVLPQTSTWDEPDVIQPTSAGVDAEPQPPLPKRRTLLERFGW